MADRPWRWNASATRCFHLARELTAHGHGPKQKCNVSDPRLLFRPRGRRARLAGPRRAESSASRACSSMSIASSQSLGASPKLVAAPGAAAELVEPCVFFARAEAFPAPISFAAPSVASQGPLEGAKRQAANLQLKTRKFFIRRSFDSSMLPASFHSECKRTVDSYKARVPACGRLFGASWSPKRTG